jgi:hypothetical protein
MATDRSRSQVETLGKRDGRRRAIDMDRPDDALARRALGIHEFHNNSVALFVATLKQGNP